MLYDRADYDFVTIDDGLIVNGGIMPQRDAEGAGFWKHLRAEDVAFCLEAAHERAAVANGVSPSYSDVDKHIIGARWVSAIESLQSSAETALKSGFVPQSKSIPQGATTFDEIFPGARFDLNALEADVTDFAPGAALRADAVRRVFRDLQRLRSFLRSGSTPTFPQTYTETHGGSYTTHTSAGGNRLLTHTAIKWGPEWMAPYTGNGWATATVSGTASAGSVSGGKYVGSVKVCFPVTVSKEEANKPTESTRGVLVLDGTVHGDNVSIDLSAASGTIRSFVSGIYPLVRGEDLPDPSGFDVNSVTISCIAPTTIGAGFKVVQLGDHTTF